MDNIPRSPGSEDDNPCISTIQELASYFSENREVAVELVRAFSDLFVSDGLYPIRDILGKGYEDSLRGADPRSPAARRSTLWRAGRYG